MRLHPLLAGLSAGLMLCAAGASARPPAVSRSPSAAGDRTSLTGRAMVAAANPLAAQAGMEVLRRGGSAIDAAVAIQAVLGLVEPQSSGLGGGSYMVEYDAATRHVTAYDGREVAPRAAGPDLFLNAAGKPVGFREAVLGGHSTGVPGAVAMLALAQKQHGRLAWASLFEPAERLARDGFIVSPRLAEDINGDDVQAHTPDADAYFTKPGGGRYQAGDRLRNPAYLQSLKAIAANPRALYEGPLAQAIVAKVQAASPPGALTLADMRDYRPRVSDAVCGPYRIYIVCTDPAPSGGPALLEGLGILQRTDIDRRGPSDPQAWYLFAQASRLMYADRDRYYGDPAFVQVPMAGLLDPAYLDARARLIGPRAGPPPEPGHPKGAPRVGVDATHEPGGTTHFVVVDRQGNVVSMTTTVESIFGSGRMAGGFFLNNQLTDFSFSPRNRDGTQAANAPAGGKRPRSSMAPVIILDRQGRLFGAVGSPGGPAIPAFNLKAIVGVIDWKLSMQQAIDLPNMVAVPDATYAEVAKFPPGVVKGLEARGMTLKSTRAEGSGLHGVMVRDGAYQGGADPRREGVALAD